jgi:serine/threonine protein kinase
VDLAVGLRTLASLDYPNIVKVHDVVEEGGAIALVMQWIPGRVLSDG